MYGLDDEPGRPYVCWCSVRAQIMVSSLHYSILVSILKSGLYRQFYTMFENYSMYRTILREDLNFFLKSDFIHVTAQVIHINFCNLFWYRIRQMCCGGTHYFGGWRCWKYQHWMRTLGSAIAIEIWKFACPFHTQQVHLYHNSSWHTHYHLYVH